MRQWLWVAEAEIYVGGCKRSGEGGEKKYLNKKKKKEKRVGYMFI